MSRSARRDYLSAVEHFERRTRFKGKRNGALGYVALEVAKYLSSLAVNCQGRVYPSIETIAARINRSRDAVSRALRKLAEAGFVKRIRRYVRSLTAGKGPHFQRTSNVYALETPASAAALVPPPRGALLSADELVRLRAVERSLVAMEADYRSAQAEKTGLLAQLGRLGAGVARKAASLRPPKGEETQ